MLTCRSKNIPWWKLDLRSQQTGKKCFPTGGGIAVDWSGAPEERSRGRCPRLRGHTPCWQIHIDIFMWLFLIRAKWVLKAAIKSLVHQFSPVSPSVNTNLDNMEVGSRSERENYTEEVEIERPSREPSWRKWLPEIEEVIKMLEANQDNDDGEKLNYNYRIVRMNDIDEHEYEYDHPSLHEPFLLQDEGFEEGNEVASEEGEKLGNPRVKHQIKTRGQRKIDPSLGVKRYFKGGVWKFENSELFENQSPVCSGLSHTKGLCCAISECPPVKHSCCVRVFLNRLPNEMEKNEACQTLEIAKKRMVVQLKKQNQRWEEAERCFTRCIRQIENSSKYGLTKAFLKLIIQRRLPYGKSLDQFRACCDIPREIKLFPYSRAFYIDKYGENYLEVLGNKYRKIGSRKAGAGL